jgi:hypothetical protein
MILKRKQSSGNDVGSKEMCTMFRRNWRCCRVNGCCWGLGSCCWGHSQWGLGLLSVGWLLLGPGLRLSGQWFMEVGLSGSGWVHGVGGMTIVGTGAVAARTMVGRGWVIGTWVVRTLVDGFGTMLVGGGCIIGPGITEAVGSIRMTDFPIKMTLNKRDIKSIFFSWIQIQIDWLESNQQIWF